MEATDDSIEWEEFQASMETLVSRLKCQRFTKRPVAGAVLFRGPCAFASLIVSTFGPAKWIQIFDSDKEVEDGAVPKIPSLPMSEKGFVTIAGPVLMTRGLYVCGSGIHQQKKKAETDLSMFVQILSASKDGNKL